MEFLLVRFPQIRDVLADGDVIGDTNTTLMLQAGEYRITLSGGGYTPDKQDIVLNGTSGNNPKVIVFTLAEATVTVPAPRALPKAKARRKTAAKKAKASARGKRTGKPQSKRKSR